MDRIKPIGGSILCGPHPGVVGWRIDVDYTILALFVLDQRGSELTADDVADAWLHRLPCLEVFTTEREAYAALVRGDRPPRTATEDNPFGEWIGALIRADAYGLVLPGRPRLAAELALRDASVSHVKNGLYGAMWAASLVSNALVLDDPVEVVKNSLVDLPPGRGSMKSFAAAWSCTTAVSSGRVRSTSSTPPSHCTRSTTYMS